MPILLDSPVTLYHTPDEIRAWLRHLDELAAAHPDDPSLLDAVANQRRNTQKELDFAEAVERGEIERPVEIDAQ